MAEGGGPEGIPEPAVELHRWQDLGKVVELEGCPFVITAQGPQPLREVVVLLEKGELFLPVTSEVPHPALLAASKRFRRSLLAGSQVPPKKPFLHVPLSRRGNRHQ